MPRFGGKKGNDTINALAGRSDDAFIGSAAVTGLGQPRFFSSLMALSQRSTGKGR
jgi:hypothetical protein